jgi:putative transposase
MPRRPRQEAPGAVHHVVFQGNGRCRIVLDSVDAERLWNGVGLVSRECGWECISACLLGTHFHGILRTSEPNLGEGMRLLLGSYGRWFNLRHGREGHLLRSPYWSKRVRTNDHVLVGASYLDLNPVRAGLCAHPADWRWSTHRELVGLDPPALAQSDRLLLWLGNGDVERGRAAYAAVVEQDLARLRTAREERHRLLAYLEELSWSARGREDGRAGEAEASPRRRPLREARG